MIVKQGSKYVKAGTKTPGTHTTKSGAVNQLKAIEANKHKKKGK